MTRREKIIVGLMLAAAAGAAIDFAIASKASSTAAKRNSPDSEIAAAISNARVELATFHLSPLRQRIQENLAREWRDEILAPPAETTAKTVPETAQSAPAMPVYSGYFEIDGKPLAIIDGRDYIEGEWLTDSPFQLIKISPAQAKLKPREGNEPIVILLETGSFQ